MKALIIEDEMLTAQRLEAMLKKYEPGMEVLAVLPSVSASIQWFTSNPDPDLVFMDIHLEDGQSFAIFEKINLDVPVIFTTAYDEYMIKAFKVNSVDYLMKPVNYEELVAAIDKFKRLRKQDAPGSQMDALMQSIQPKEQEYKSRFLISIGSKLKAIETDDIQYFYSAEKLSFLVTKDNQRFPVDYSLDKLNVLLDPKDFFRINRQMMVRLSAIEHIHVFPKGRLKLDLQPVMKDEVLVSLDKVTAFKEWLGK
ncbi:MAG TPA: DNA-binding response regulator [Chitinophagaceae bacterium]|nr:DNA-binding response regulator [Chitinophagaceae bacterium]HRF25780.1 LytTR family DNA-binding domain-containing protein [Ferruginibacter sp.]